MTEAHSTSVGALTVDPLAAVRAGPTIRHGLARAIADTSTQVPLTGAARVDAAVPRVTRSYPAALLHNAERSNHRQQKYDHADVTRVAGVQRSAQPVRLRSSAWGMDYVTTFPSSKLGVKPSVPASAFMISIVNPILLCVSKLTQTVPGRRPEPCWATRISCSAR